MSDKQMGQQTPELGRPGDEVPPGTPGSGEDVCPRCHGSGRIESQPCENCAGTGKITRAIGGA